MSMSYRSRWITRRSFLYGVAATGGSLVAAPLLSRRALAETAKPSVTHGVQSGDILTDRAIV
jgi:phosphodiesterase/alkaline phosphatase D-like protein